MVNSKNHFNPIEIFVSRLFRMTANQNAPDLNRGLSSNFWWLRSANHVKFTEERVLCTENHVLAKKNFTNWLDCLNKIKKKR